VIRDGLEQLLEIILAGGPDTDIYYIAITPPIAAPDSWEAVEAANTATETLCGRYPRCTFIATADIFLDGEARSRKKLYQFDGMHLSDRGYGEWTRRIKPHLED
jgi:lysophospholipase L1-like esterase